MADPSLHRKESRSEAIERPLSPGLKRWGEQQQLKKRVQLQELESKESSLLDLPDELITIVTESADLESRYNMRLANWKLHNIEIDAKVYLKKIYIDMVHYSHGPSICVSSRGRAEIDKNIPWNVLYNVLQSFESNTYVVETTLHNCESYRTDAYKQLVAAFFNIDARKARIAFYDDGLELFDGTVPDMMGNLITDLPSIARKVKHISVECYVWWPQIVDLRFLRNRMIDGDWKLESFEITSNRTKGERLLKSCFGVTVDVSVFAKTVTFSADDASIELYTDKYGCYYWMDIVHSEPNLLTRISGSTITFDKTKKIEDLGEDYVKVEMGHAYRYSHRDRGFRY